MGGVLRPASWMCGDKTIALAARPLVMGILNVTPDSFSDGGQFLNPQAAVRHGLAMIADGADLLDVGGESSRPGATAVPAATERERVLPVIQALIREWDGPISIDTVKASVASAAIDAGACILNDVSACTEDPDMIKVARDTRVGVVLMHRRGSPQTMQDAPRYDDVVREVGNYLDDRIAAATAAG
ncbi:MAG: dihydropteroate synthase, partial [Verrucomicrobia bacterium]|nr:dihydropteroate synthase [Verrucomicrobiota bacterium]